MMMSLDKWDLIRKFFASKWIMIGKLEIERLEDDTCDRCKTSTYVIVAEWDWFHHSQWKERICGRCFNLAEWGQDIEQLYMKRKNDNE